MFHTPVAGRQLTCASCACLMEATNLCLMRLSQGTKQLEGQPCLFQVCEERPRGDALKQAAVDVLAQQYAGTLSYLVNKKQVL